MPAAMPGPAEYINCFLSIQHSTFNRENNLREVNPGSCTFMFIATMFMVAKTWKKPTHTHTHTHTHARAHVCTYIHTEEYYSTIKNENYSISDYTEGL